MRLCNIIHTTNTTILSHTTNTTNTTTINDFIITNNTITIDNNNNTIDDTHNTNNTTTDTNVDDATLHILPALRKRRILLTIRATPMPT